MPTRSSKRTVLRPVLVLLFGVGLTLSGACSRTFLKSDDPEDGSGGGGGGANVSSSVTSTLAYTATGSSTNTATGTGGTNVCDSAVQCEDNNACTSNVCENGFCVHPPRDDDDDGYLPVICGGPDCNDLNPNVYPGALEDCKDGADNNCNGVTDCFDPACEAVKDCGCKPSPSGENCANTKDDDCDTTVDCNDTDCIGTPACGCSASESGLCENGFDDDCDGLIDCDDGSCAGELACICQGSVESCSDGEDEDCDLLVDCADPDCSGLFPCACEPPGTPEQCADGTDNDCDQKVDCGDPDCLVSPFCDVCTTEICDDGKDNSCDGKIDCADPVCVFAPGCTPTPEVCNNSLDDDHDSLIDCQDPDCKNTPFCVLQQANCLSPKLIPGTGTYTGDTTGNVSETKGVCGGDAGEAVFYFVLTDPAYVHLDSIGSSFDSTLYVRTGKCNSGKEIGCDDDSGGSTWAAMLEFSLLYPGTYYVFLDGYTIDPRGGANEGPFALNVEIVPNPKEICNDKKDNDGDVYVDCADPDCKSAAPCLNCANGQPPSAEFGVAACIDGKDNDCDGATDCSDDDCSASDYYITECCNGLDENDNQVADDFNCRCATDLDCDPGQICYTHTAYACGIPCEQYFGDVCPFVAAGSYCNGATQQCEF